MPSLVAAAGKSGRGGKQAQGGGGGGGGGSSGNGARRKRWRPEELDPMIAAEDAELKVRLLAMYLGTSYSSICSSLSLPLFSHSVAPC